MGTFSLTDVAEKGDEGSGSLCPRGSSVLDKQTPSPFLQGQGTRGTVKTSFSKPTPADAQFPRGRRPLASAARRVLLGRRVERGIGSLVSPVRSPRKVEEAWSTLLCGLSTAGGNARPNVIAARS